MSYVECHGTGTPMGDPIEIAALTQAFAHRQDRVLPHRQRQDQHRPPRHRGGRGQPDQGRRSPCATARSPRASTSRSPTPRLEIGDTPFVVNDRLSEWRREGTAPRRAGVNSLGVGGTNAFVVVEEAPERAPATGRRGPAAARPVGPERQGARRPGRPPGRPPPRAPGAGPGRRRLDPPGRSAPLPGAAGARRPRPRRGHRAARRPATPGGCSPTPRRPPTVRSRSCSLAAAPSTRGWPPTSTRPSRCSPSTSTRGCGACPSDHGLDLRPLILCAPDQVEEAQDELARVAHQLPAIFVVEHALARLLMSWGIEPTALVGHSVGENTAACISGTMSFGECLGLVVLRGRLTDRVRRRDHRSAPVTGGRRAVPRGHRARPRRGEQPRPLGRLGHRGGRRRLRGPPGRRRAWRPAG